MQTIYDNDGAGGFTIKYRGHEIRVTQDCIENPRDRDFCFTFVSCVSPQDAANKLGDHDETNYSRYECPDNELFRPCGNIYVDSLRLLKDKIPSSELVHRLFGWSSEEEVTRAQQIVEEYFHVFPVWLSRDQNGKLTFTCGTLEEFKENNGEPLDARKNSILFGALCTTKQPTMFHPNNGDFMTFAKIAVDQYSSWVNGDTYIIDVTMSDKLAGLLLNLKVGDSIYHGHKESIHLLQISGFGDIECAEAEVPSTIRGLDDDIEDLKVMLLEVYGERIDPEDKAEILAVIDEK